ncbi:MAG: hypothetical protein MUE34_03270 [Acidimicrobiales bacterium]|nr:hypothetical protein [Acidimicrobiales bacterium]
MRGRWRRLTVGGFATISVAAFAAAALTAEDAEAGPRTVVVMDLTESYEGEGHSLTYSVSGVELDPATDAPYHHTGTVVGDRVTLSGSATYTIPEGMVTNLGMSASLSVSGGESLSESWPPPGTDGRVGGTTITFPFELTVEIPPPPPTTTSPYGPDPNTTEAATPTTAPPYTSVFFSVSSLNCNDWGVCGGPRADGTFAVYGTAGGGGDDSPDWLATVGALGAAAAAAAALAGSNGGRSGDRYVLQVSTDTLTVTPEQPAGLQVQVWRVGPSGATMPAPDAVTQLIGSPGISVHPATGGAAVGATVTVAEGAVGSGDDTIDVSATAGGGTMHATVRVDRSGAYELELY